MDSSIYPAYVFLFATIVAAIVINVYAEYIAYKEKKERYCEIVTDKWGNGVCSNCGEVYTWYDRDDANDKLDGLYYYRSNYCRNCGRKVKKPNISSH